MTRLRNLVALTAVPLVHAHFTFVRLAHNGVWAEPLQYIRNKTTPFLDNLSPQQSQNTERYYNFPTFNGDFANSIRCGRGNLDHANETETLTIQAGDQLEMAITTMEPGLYGGWKESHFRNCPDNRGVCPAEDYRTEIIIHDGPAFVHLSAVPEDSSFDEYDGSGEWVKIYTLGVELSKEGYLRWLPRNLGGGGEAEPLPPHFIFNVPKETPAGDYLMRMDLIWPGLDTVENSPQLYPTCAHLRVESDVSGSLPKGILIPEAFQDDSEGMRTSLSQYRLESLDEGYTYPGGPIWDGKELKVDLAP